MKREEYKKMMEEMRREANSLDEGLYYSITDDGKTEGTLDITPYCRSKEFYLYKWDVKDIEEIIYNENLAKEDIDEAKKVMEKYNPIFQRLEEMDLLSKTEQAYKLTELISNCIDNEVLEDYGEGDDAIQYIYRTAEKWGMLYLWYTYIYKNAYNIVYNN